MNISDETVGVSKDLGGALILRIPSELIQRANDPVNYPNEAAEYAQIQKDAGALHAGETSYIVLTSDVDPATKTPDYDLQFKGVEGQGTQYNTSDIIDQKRKSIYNVFGAGFLLLGQNGSGSYALSSSQTTTHGFYVQRNIAWKTDVINTQLVPTLLAANNIQLDWKDVPVFVPKDPDELSLDELGKAIQRMKSVQGLTPSALEDLYLKAGLPTEGIEDLDFSDKGASRSGESQGSSGTGNTQNEGAASAVNSENGGVAKNLVVDYETEEQIVAVDTATGSPIFIDKEG